MSTVERLASGALVWGKITLAREDDSDADASYFYEDDKIRIDLALDNGQWSVCIETGYLKCDGAGPDEASALDDGVATLREILRETEATIQEVGPQ